VYEVLFTPGAAREFEGLYRRDRRAAVRIERTIGYLSKEPRLRGVEKLRSNIYRIRVGEFRIVYTIEEKDKVLIISRIRRRTETTYRGI